MAGDRVGAENVGWNEGATVGKLVGNSSVQPRHLQTLWLKNKKEGNNQRIFLMDYNCKIKILKHMCSLLRTKFISYILSCNIFVLIFHLVSMSSSLFWRNILLHAINICAHIQLWIEYASKNTRNYNLLKKRLRNILFKIYNLKIYFFYKQVQFV